MVGIPSSVPGVVDATSQRTAGTLAGTRPRISRSKSSTSSGRRWFHQTLAEVTGLPLFRTSGLGRLGQGLALDSSQLTGLGPEPFCATPGRSAVMCRRSDHVLVVRGDGGLGRGGCGLGGLRRGRLREGRHEQEGERESERVGAHGVAETIADSRRDWHWGAQRKAPHPVARWDCAPRMGHPVPAEDGTPARTDKGKYRGPSLRSG